MTGRPTTFVPSLRVNTPENKRLLIVLLLAGAMLVAPWLLDWPDRVARGMLAVSLTLIAVALLMVLQSRVRLNARAMATDLLTGFIEKDATPTFVTDVNPDPIKTAKSLRKIAELREKFAEQFPKKKQTYIPTRFRQGPAIKLFIGMMTYNRKQLISE